MDSALREDPDEVLTLVDHNIPFCLLLWIPFLFFFCLFISTFPRNWERESIVVKLNGDPDALAIHDQYFFQTQGEVTHSNLLFLNGTSSATAERNPFSIQACDHFRVSKNLQAYIASVSLLLPPASFYAASITTTVSGLSTGEEEQVLDAFRSAMLYGTPWLILTGSTSEVSRACIDFLLHSLDVPHRLFNEEVLSRIAEYTDPTILSKKKQEELLRLARDLNHFFQTFSTTLGSWMAGKRKVKGWDIPYSDDDQLQKKNVWDARVELWKRVVKQIYNNTCDDGSRPNREIPSEETSEKDFPATSQERCLMKDDGMAFGDNSRHTSHPLHEFGQVESVPRMVTLPDNLQLVLPGIIILTHPDVYHRLDLVGETLATLMTTKILTGVLLKKDELPTDNSAYQSNSKSSKHYNLTHPVNTSRNSWASFPPTKLPIYRPGVMLHFPSDSVEIASASSSDFSILFRSFFLHEWEISLGNSILLESTSLPAIFLNSSHSWSLVNPIVEMTSQVKNLIFVSTKPTTTSRSWFSLLFFYPLKLFRKLKSEISYHFFMVETSLIHFPRASPFVFRLAHYIVYLFRRVEISLYGYSFFFQLLNWVYKVDRGSFGILKTTEFLFNNSFFQSLL